MPRSTRRQLASSLLAAGLPTTLPAAPPPPQIASPWADASQLEVATFAGLLDAMDVLPVSRSLAMSIPAVSRGRDLIATTTARLPLFAATADGRLPVQPRIVSQPEEGRARYTTLTWTVDSLIFYGVAWWQITSRYAPTHPGDLGKPRTVRWVPQSAVEVDTYGQIISAFGRRVDPATEILRFDGPNEGFLSRAGDTIRQARRLTAAAGRASDNPVPSVELHQTQGEPLTEPEIDNLIARWSAARRGENGGVAFTNASVQAIMHGTFPEHLLVAGREAIALDVARHLNLSAWAVDATTEGSSLTYSNVPSRSRELIDYTLSGYMEAIVGRLSLDDVLPAGTFAAFSTDVLTNGDFGDRMTAGKTAVDAGIYTPAEMAARERGIPLEDRQVGP